MDIHRCSYFCGRPECIKRQRDELREELLVRPGSSSLDVAAAIQMSKNLDLLSKVLAQQIVRLARALAQARPESNLPKQSTEFLERIGFMDEALKNIPREN